MSIGILVFALLLGLVILAFWLRARGRPAPLTRTVAMAAVRSGPRRLPGLG